MYFKTRSFILSLMTSMVFCLFDQLLFCPKLSAENNDREISLFVDTDRCTLTVLSGGVARKQYAVALGKPETPTPIGEWKVISKYKNWGNGFGTRWIGLNVPWGTYGIHGTNKPFSIGRNMSSGCIRMHNAEVEQLYEWVTIGTHVEITGHPLRHAKRLSIGSVGVDVWLVQDRLTLMGFYHGRIDGRFGVGTERAVRDFEKAHGLPVDGVVGFHDYRNMGLEE